MWFFNRIKKLDPLEGYNKWANTYHEEENPIKKTSDDFILENLPAGTLLDAGCGSGKICEAAIKRGNSSVKGIDLSPAMIEQAKKNCPQGEFECADLSTVDIERSTYDVVVCGLVLGHIEELKPVLTKLISALKPAGHIILTDFHPHQTAMKAKRTFKDAQTSRTFEIKHSLHTLDEYFAILKSSGVAIVDFKEPKFNNTPVIFGIHGVVS